jgi:CRP-like cAMP-binding protein
VGEWLLPHMTRREVKAGETLWRIGDVATEMIYVDSGRLRLVEQDTTLGFGSLVGEIDLFSPDNRRTGTIVCDTDCTLYTLSAGAMAQLHYLNPQLGFHVMRLVVARLMHDVEVARAPAAADTPAPAPVALPLATGAAAHARTRSDLRAPVLQTRPALAAAK